MKNFMIAFFVLLFLAGQVYAYGNVNLSLSSDIGELLIYSLDNQLSVSGNIEISLPQYFSITLHPGFIKNMGFGIMKLGLECRFYWPENPPKGFFIGTGIEYLLVNIPEGSVGDFWASTFDIPIRLGYKWVLINEGLFKGLFIEPFIGYQIPLWTVLDGIVMDGYIGGFWIGINTGFSFSIM